MNKKAAIGIGTLIIFISAILTAAISAGVLLHTQTRLQSEALQVGKDAREAVGTSILIEKILGENVISHSINRIKLRMRLGPSSSSIRFNDTTIVFISNNVTNTYNYIGSNSSATYINQRNRTIDWDITSEDTRLKTDLDGDYIEDYIAVTDATTLTIKMSKNGNLNITIPNISTINTEFNHTSFDINTTRRIGKLYINGNNSLANSLSGLMQINLQPENMLIGLGGYAVTHSIRGSKDDLDDVLLYGDITWVYFDTSEPVGEGWNLALSVHTPKGVPAMKELKTPDTILSGTVSIFP